MTNEMEAAARSIISLLQQAESEGLSTLIAMAAQSAGEEIDSQMITVLRRHILPALKIAISAPERKEIDDVEKAKKMLSAWAARPVCGIYGRRKRIWSMYTDIRDQCIVFMAEHENNLSTNEVTEIYRTTGMNWRSFAEAATSALNDWDRAQGYTMKLGVASGTSD